MPDFTPPTPIIVDHDCTGFDCGKSSLNEFLTAHALAKQNAMLSRTYVVTDGSPSVVAYYTLAHVTIVRDEAPKRIGRGMPNAIPSMLLARLAIDQKFQGKGLGRSLFADAVKRTWAVMQGSAAPVRFFVVDAIDDEARGFYESLGMVPSPSDPMRLFLHYKDIQGLFAGSG